MSKFILYWEESSQQSLPFIAKIRVFTSKFLSNSIYIKILASQIYSQNILPNPIFTYSCEKSCSKSLSQLYNFMDFSQHIQEISHYFLFADKFLFRRIVF